MKRILCILVTLVMVVFSFVACGNGTPAQAPADTAPADDRPVVVFSKSSDTPFFALVEQGLMDAAEELGVNLRLTSAGSRVDRQIADVETMLLEGVDAIIMSPVDRDALNSLVDTVVDSGTILVLVNTFSSNDRYDVYVGSPEEEAGNLQAQWLLENIGPTGRLGILYGEMGHSAQIGREAGLLQGLGIAHRDERGGNWEVIAAQTGNWDRAQGRQIMEDWIIAHGDAFDAIAAQDDEMAMGALQALQENNLADRIAVLGIDGKPFAAQSIGEGGMVMSAFQDGYKQGFEAMVAAFRLINGETVPKYVKIPFVNITIENYRDFL